MSFSDLTKEKKQYMALGAIAAVALVVVILAVGTVVDDHGVVTDAADQHQRAKPEAVVRIPDQVCNHSRGDWPCQIMIPYKLSATRNRHGKLQRTFTQILQAY